jgi:hypothetical protein
MINVDHPPEGSAEQKENVRQIILAILLILSGVALGAWTDTNASSAFQADASATTRDDGHAEFK